jgi:hypothetical protein
MALGCPGSPPHYPPEPGPNPEPVIDRWPYDLTDPTIDPNVDDTPVDDPDLNLPGCSEPNSDGDCHMFDVDPGKEPEPEEEEEEEEESNSDDEEEEIEESSDGEETDDSGETSE